MTMGDLGESRVQKRGIAVQACVWNGGQPRETTTWWGPTQAIVTRMTSSGCLFPPSVFFFLVEVKMQEIEKDSNSFATWAVNLILSWFCFLAG